MRSSLAPPLPWKLHLSSYLISQEAGRQLFSWNIKWVLIGDWLKSNGSVRKELILLHNRDSPLQSLCIWLEECYTEDNICISFCSTRCPVQFKGWPFPVSVSVPAEKLSVPFSWPSKTRKKMSEASNTPLFTLASLFHTPGAWWCSSGEESRQCFIHTYPSRCSCCRVPCTLPYTRQLYYHDILRNLDTFFRLSLTTCVIDVYVVLLYQYKDREEPM